MKVFQEGRWVDTPYTGGIAYLKPGEYEAGIMRETDDFIHNIGYVELNQLIDFLFKNGHIKPQLGENRTEDTKIIHRLIDVIEVNERGSA